MPERDLQLSEVVINPVDSSSSDSVPVFLTDSPDLAACLAVVSGFASHLLFLWVLP